LRGAAYGHRGLALTSAAPGSEPEKHSGKPAFQISGFRDRGMHRMIRPLPFVTENLQLPVNMTRGAAYHLQQLVRWQVHGARGGYQIATGPDQAQRQLVDCMIARQAILEVLPA